jgi:hypothetical protein
MIMKKNFFLYLLMMAFPIAFFSCGDKDNGDEPPKPTSWQDGVGAYRKSGAGITGTLTINGAEADSTKTVILAAGSDNNAKITLGKLVPDDANVEFDNVEMKKSGNDYTFSSETKVGTTTITLSGTLSGIPATKATSVSKALDIKIARKINSPVASVWKLNFTNAGGDVFFDVSTGDAVKDTIFNKSLAAMLGGMLMQKVSNVTATFSEDGLFDVTWINQGGTEIIGMPPSVKEMVKILYFATEDQVFIALAKTHIPMLQALAGDIDLTPLLAAMTDKGDFLALPLHINVFTGEEIPTGDIGYGFYIEKEMVLAALPLIAPMLGNLGGQLLPEMATALGPLLNSFPEIVANSEKFNIGLNFTGKDNALK